MTAISADSTCLLQAARISRDRPFEIVVRDRWLREVWRFAPYEHNGHVVYRTDATFVLHLQGATLTAYAFGRCAGD